MDAATVVIALAAAALALKVLADLTVRHRAVERARLRTEANAAALDAAADLRAGPRLAPETVPPAGTGTRTAR